jgi:hypothetical protein
METMDFLLQKKPERILARVSTKTKEHIGVICEMRGINESQYINLALENQIKADLQKEQFKQTLKLTNP